MDGTRGLLCRLHSAFCRKATSFGLAPMLMTWIIDIEESSALGRRAALLSSNICDQHVKSTSSSKITHAPCGNLTVHLTLVPVFCQFHLHDHELNQADTANFIGHPTPSACSQAHQRLRLCLHLAVPEVLYYASLVVGHLDEDSLIVSLSLRQTYLRLSAPSTWAGSLAQSHSASPSPASSSWPS